MKTTIDKAGRLVIPKVLRDRAGLVAGEVEVTVDGAGLRIDAVFHSPLVEIGGQLFLAEGGPELSPDDIRELRLGDQR